MICRSRIRTVGMRLPQADEYAAAIWRDRAQLYPFFDRLITAQVAAHAPEQIIDCNNRGSGKQSSALLQVRTRRSGVARSAAFSTAQWLPRIAA